MSSSAVSSSRTAGVDTRGLEERTLLQAELMVHDGQLREFTPLRDRLVATGQDANAAYARILSRRDQVRAELKKLMPVYAAPIVPAAPRPLRAIGSFPSIPLWGLISSGMVQAGRASEGVNLIGQGKYPTTGSINTITLSDTADVEFGGVLSVGPSEFPQSAYDPSLQYFWLHNWHFLIPFPAAKATSIFTYSFVVEALVNVSMDGGPVTFMAFASVGETADFVGQDVAVTTDVGWPLMADLTKPDSAGGSLYNGSYGYIEGRTVVERSFTVQAGNSPAVALVLGVVSSQSMASDVNYDIPFAQGYSAISAGSYGYPGCISYSYRFPSPVITHGTVTSH